MYIYLFEGYGVQKIQSDYYSFLGLFHFLARFKLTHSRGNVALIISLSVRIMSLDRNLHARLLREISGG